MELVERFFFFNQVIYRLMVRVEHGTVGRSFERQKFANVCWRLEYVILVVGQAPARTKPLMDSSRSACVGERVEIGY